MIVYGPVPSRRLGRSLGINLIPSKLCSYSCVYCQLGRTDRLQQQRRPFCAPETLKRHVGEKLARLAEIGEDVDYLTFVADGETTLDVNLGREIEAVGGFGIKVAVITNASLILRPDVRADLCRADWVSLKVDAVDERVWRKINRPHGDLALGRIQDGMIEFARDFGGQLTTETMLVQGINDQREHMERVADFLSELCPTAAFLSVPIRPPAEQWARPPSPEAVTMAYATVHRRVPQTEYLIGYEGNAFTRTGDAAADLLSITSVHPMREDAVQSFLAAAGADGRTVAELVQQGRLIQTRFEGHTFYVRPARAWGRPSAEAGDRATGE
jgi:wyosine [tRNA(Phe)-imidazoG37] synthetase (radical SAM superfamily)